VSAAPRNTGASELGGGFILMERADGPTAILAPQLASAGVVALMSTASMNARTDNELADWARRAGVPAAEHLAQVRQVHDAQVLKAPLPAPDVEADGLWCDTPDVALTVRVADCAPVWIADTKSRRFALLHAGWRGVAAGIVTEALGLLREAGSEPANLVVATGPHLQACCFEVGPEVAERFSRWPQAILPASRLQIPQQRTDSFALDLAAVLSAQLRVGGIRGENMFASTACTRCNNDLFHSYRRNGSGGPLMAAFAARAK
jgi:polyphenol oxidase